MMFFVFFIMSGKNFKKSNDYQKFSDMSRQEKLRAWMGEADAFMNKYNVDFAPTENFKRLLVETMFFPDSLSLTEFRVLRLIYQNAKARKPHTVGFLADALGVSKHTIRTHMKSIFFKLDVNSTLSAVIVGIELGILAADNC